MYSRKLKKLSRKNPEFEACIDAIPGGRALLAISNIRKHYNPVIEFQSGNGSMVYCAPLNVRPQRYVAAFDLDWTITASENKLYPGSASADDIRILPGRREKLTSLFKSGYTLAVFTNQTCKGAKALERVLGRMKTFLLDLGLPCYLFVSTGKDENRKPDLGMWRQLQQLIPDIQYAFYVGDAAGRPQDFGDSDKLFAEAAGIPFYLPENIFPCQRIKPTADVIILVGAPGTGKSTIGQSLAATIGAEYVSRDSFGGNKRKYLEAVRRSIKEGRVVIDATNGTQEDRQTIYSMAKSVEVIYFLRDGHGWNKLRQGQMRVPDIAYHRYYKSMVPPNKDIGVKVTVVNDPCN